MKHLLLLLGLIVSGPINAQKSYFQQKTEYAIQVSLDAPSHMLRGHISILYYNNSQDVLDRIGFHLYPNAYKNQNTAFARQKIKTGDLKFYDAPESEMGFIDSLQFEVDHETASYAPVDHQEDMIWLQLNRPLRPGQSIRIETPFRVKIPRNFSRLGYDENSFQISQWYPKPAVYDAKGWHLMPYLDQGEFYSEFGSFDVEIQVPKHYVVAATGSLQTESEKQWLIKKAQWSDRYIKFGTAPPQDQGGDSSALKSLRFIAEDVHDFAWFADPYFQVQHRIQKLDNGKEIDIWAMYRNTAVWSEAASSVARSVEFFSREIGPYPWPQATAVEGTLFAGGGMEYPMITVIGNMSGKAELDNVIAHEVCHNWFYGILGSNERKHPFMDEGLTSYYENRYMLNYYGATAMDWFENPLERITGPLHLEKLLYLFSARTYLDQYPNQEADRFTPFNYGNDVYYKTARLFEYLEDYLGKEQLDSIMRAYFEIWKFRHPYPEDLQKIFEEKSYKDTRWLFDGFLNSSKKMDYALCSMKRSGDSITVSVKNKGRIQAPIKLTGVREGIGLYDAWIDGFSGTKKVRVPTKDYEYFALDIDETSFDLYPGNNYLATHGLFKKYRPLRISWFVPVDRPQTTDLGITPVIGYNPNNRFMAGLYFSGPWLPSRKCNLWLMPMFSFHNQDWAGQAGFKYKLYFPDMRIHHLEFGLGFKKFSYAHNIQDEDLAYMQWRPSLEIHFSTIPANNTSSVLAYQAIWQQDEFTDFKDTSRFTNHVQNTVHTLKYNYDHRSSLGDLNGELRLRYSQNKLSTSEKQRVLRLELSLQKAFRYQKDRFGSIRFYLACFPIQTERNSTYISTRSAPYFYKGSAGLSYQNYLDEWSEEFFVGRTETKGLWSQQIAAGMGGFKLNIGEAQRENAGNSNSLVAAVNLGADLPIKTVGKFLRLYWDLGFFKHPDLSSQDSWLSSAGLQLKLLPGLVDVYFPVLHSSRIRTLYDADAGHTYWKEICFSLKLNLADLHLQEKLFGNP